MRCGGIIYDSIVLNTVLPLYSLVIFPANSIETHDKSIRQHGFHQTEVVWLSASLSLSSPPPALPPTWSRVILPFCPTFLLLNLLLILYCCATEFLGTKLATVLVPTVTLIPAHAAGFLKSASRNRVAAGYFAIRNSLNRSFLARYRFEYLKITRSNIRHINRFVLSNRGGKIYFHHACKRTMQYFNTSWIWWYECQCAC